MKMKKQLALMHWCLGKISSSNDFRKLNHAIASIRKRKDDLSRSERLVLLREINNKIEGFG